MRLRHLISAIVIAFFLLTVAAPQPALSADDAKAKEIVRLSGLTNVLAIMDQMSLPFVDLVIKELRSRNPTIPEKTVEVFREEFVRAFGETNREMLAFSVKLYVKYFSREDIQVLNRFYKTETGQKAIKVMPQLLQEVIQFAQKWGPRKVQETFDKVRKKLQAQGHKI